MAEELTRSLTTLAERGVPRGAAAVLADAREDAIREPAPRWVQRPAWAAATAFVTTMAVLGGSLVFGLAMRRPGTDVGSSWFPEAIGDVASTATGWWLLALAIAAALAVVGALVVRNQQHRTSKERTMTTTIERPPAEQIETTERNNRWLVIAVVVLALALLALGAWVIFDQASQPETAATTEVEALYDDYVAAWTDSDADAFTELGTENFVFTSFGVTFSQSEQAASVAMSGNPVFERVGDLVVMGDGPDYFVTAAERITLRGTEYFGVSAYRIVETEDGLRIAEHHWVGNV